MSIPNEALQKLLQEIEARATLSHQQLQVVRGQVAGKQRDIRLNQLTITELESLPKDTNVYEGVGKMFVLVPMDNVKSRLEGEVKALSSDVEDLNKKLQYQEMTFQKTQENISALLQRGA
ncbi:Prefoldin [Terfezia boudieri ATCC MYA-4762]|uniref:Prefoldin n=1 Tax=Terfezia boudieri ATCC MYA-4762 TaxID=1051890 RepID=A0A3N4LYI1_9PEZI|nr:Prefoldin [Terfezia boudieri ATCC MYA-4762]